VLLRVVIMSPEKGLGQWKPHQIGNFDDTIRLRLNQCCHSVFTEKHQISWWKKIDSQKKKTLDHKYVTDFSDYKKTGVVLRSRWVFRTLYIY